MIHFNKHIHPLFLIILLLVFSGYIRAGETSTWVDKNGTVNSIVKNNPAPLDYASRCTFTVQASHTIGTGFFISPKGYAITCKHVIEEEGRHTAILHNREEYPIGIISESDEYDLALILVTTNGEVPYLELKNPIEMDTGDMVYVVGRSVDLKNKITNGQFTGLRSQEPEGQRTLQFSAPVNPGNSGSPLINKDGKVIGAVSWKLLSNNGIPVSDIGFAVPSDYILKEYKGYISSE